MGTKDQGKVREVGNLVKWVVEMGRLSKLLDWGINNVIVGWPCWWGKLNWYFKPSVLVCQTRLKQQKFVCCITLKYYLYFCFLFRILMLKIAVLAFVAHIFLISVSSFSLFHTLCIFLFVFKGVSYKYSFRGLRFYLMLQNYLTKFITLFSVKYFCYLPEAWTHFYEI